MTEVTPEKKSAVLKLLAIFGFIAIIIGCVWLGVQIVRYAPTAFQSVASLAESVNTVRVVETPDLEVRTDRQVVQSGTTVEVSWNEIPNTTYTFSYSCTDGIAIDLFIKSERLPVACNTPFPLESTQAVMMEVASERNRFADVDYVITAIATDSDEAVDEDRGTLTVMNVEIPVASSTPDTATSTETDAEDEVAEEPEVTPTTPSEPTTPNQPTGVADLSTSFVAVGTLTDSGTFRPASEVDNDDPIAVQFRVRNIGSVTSDVYTLWVTLDGETILSSGSESVLQPGQEATLTIEFTTNDSGRVPFGITITSANDLNGQNNRFTQLINITD